MGAGIGGQFAHMPSSAVRSKFRNRNGTTSVRPARMMDDLPHCAKTGAVFLENSSSSASVWVGMMLDREEMVEISEWK